MEKRTWEFSAARTEERMFFTKQLEVTDGSGWCRFDMTVRQSMLVFTETGFVNVV